MEFIVPVASLLSACAAIGAVILSALNRRKIEQVHISINSRMDQLLKARGEASMAEGVEQGRNEMRIVDPVKVEIVNIPEGLNKEK